VTTDAPKYVQAAQRIRDQISDGTLKPGQPAPSGARLARETGYSALTCRKALRQLIKDGALTPGPSPTARARVAGPAVTPSPPAPGTRARAAVLSADLAKRRKALGLTQPALAALTGYSVTAIGHAETGRNWQSRRFWEKTDCALAADGQLLYLYEAYTAADATAAEPGPEPGPERKPPTVRTEPPAPALIMIIWSDGTVTTAYPPAADQPSRRAQVRGSRAANPPTGPPRA
jgi:hypothetical protein